VAILAYQVTNFAYQGAGLFAYQGSVDTAAPERFAGGWEYGRRARRRAEEELRAEREKWGILPAAVKVISALAVSQADALPDDEERVAELERELQLAGVRYQAQYLELLNIQRQRLIDAEIKDFFDAQFALDEENKRRLMLLLAFLS
jgi:hypothetical protein